MDQKLVIDADHMVVLEVFKKENTKEVLEKYEQTGRWEDVSIDCNGDIILWED